jgi:glycosyltransferase involved in cell wall biosynthesis
VELSIITCTIAERVELLNKLHLQLCAQVNWPGSVEHIIVPGDGTIGRKINKGLRLATGRYVCVVDDDDEVSENYVDSLLKAIQQEPDVVTFGVRRNEETYYLRAGADEHAANHLCAWKREIALSAPCLPRNYGWDVVWYTALQLVKRTEYHIHEVLYKYNYSKEGTRAQSPESIADSIDTNGARIKFVRLEDGRIAAGPRLPQMWVQNMEVLDLRNAKVEMLKEVVFT